MAPGSSLRWKLIVLVLGASLVPGLLIARLPAGTTLLDGADRLPAGKPRLLVSTGVGLLDVGARGAAWIAPSPSLAVQPVAWPPELVVDEITGVTWHRGRLYVAFDDDADPPRHRIVALERDRVLWHRTLDFAPAGLGVDDERVVYFDIRRGFGFHLALVTRYDADTGQPVDYHGVDRKADLDELGIVWRDGEPLLLLRPHHGVGQWQLMTFDGVTEPLGCGATPWSPSLLDTRHLRGHYLDDGVCTEVSHDVPAFSVGRYDQLGALSVGLRQGETRTRQIGAGRPWGFFTDRGSVIFSDDYRATTIAAIEEQATRDGFVAFPSGEGAIVLRLGAGAPTEGFLLDGDLHRVDAGRRGVALRNLLARNGGAWIGLGALLLLLTATLPVALFYLLRRRAVAPSTVAAGARGLFTGTLCLPPGAVLATVGGHVELPAAGCHVRVAGQAIALAAGTRRVGWMPQVPLIDGEPVHVVGRVVGGDSDGGPFRSDGRLRLVGDGGEAPAIGSGDADAFINALARRRAGLAIGVVAAHVVITLAFIAGLL